MNPPSRGVSAMALGCLAAVSMVVTGCGGRPTPVAVASSAGVVVPLTSGSGAPSSPALSTTDARSATGTGPGEAFDGGPVSGQRLSVVGVPPGKQLEVFSGPGGEGSPVATVTGSTGGLTALGQARLVPGGGRTSTIWVKVRAAGGVGWVDGGYVASAGARQDLTAEVIARLGSRPRAETMADLGTRVAQAYRETEPPSAVTVVVDPVVGTVGEITLDVIGLGDDSVAGQRLQIVGTPGVESFTLQQVWGIPLCARGVAASGLCL